MSDDFLPSVVIVDKVERHTIKRCVTRRNRSMDILECAYCSCGWDTPSASQARIDQLIREHINTTTQGNTEQ